MEEIIQDELSKGVELHIAGEFDLAAQCYGSFFFYVLRAFLPSLPGHTSHTLTRI